MKFRFGSKPVIKRKPMVTQKLKQVDMQAKVAISIRLDQDIIDWFKDEHPSGYQSAINKVLSDHVRKQKG